MRENAKLMYEIIGGDSQAIAGRMRRSRQVIERQYDPDYPNLLDLIEGWIDVLAEIKLEKLDKFELWFKLKVRKAKRRIRGIILPFPSEWEPDLVLANGKLEEILGI